MPLVTCHFSNGTVYEVNADSGRPFLELALEQGVPIRNQCRSGTCLSCLCRSDTAGHALAPQAGRATSLMPMERAEGKMLCCASEAVSDGALYFDYSSEEAGPTEVQAFVDSIEWIASDAVKLTVELAEGWILEPGSTSRLVCLEGARLAVTRCAQRQVSCRNWNL